MGAWRLRAIVYGLLALVAALVLWQSGALAGDPPRPHALHGRTQQGGAITLAVRGRDLVALDARRLASLCANGGTWRSRWYPSMTQANVTYRRDGDRIQVHERPHRDFGDTLRSHVNLYLDARVSGDGNSVQGRIWYTGDPGGIHCESGSIPFAAKP
jgi:hypothetical protein